MNKDNGGVGLPHTQKCCWVGDKPAELSIAACELLGSLKSGKAPHRVSSLQTSFSPWDFCWMGSSTEPAAELDGRKGSQVSQC